MEMQMRHLLVRADSCRVPDTQSIAREGRSHRSRYERHDPDDGARQGVIGPPDVRDMATGNDKDVPGVVLAHIQECQGGRVREHDARRFPACDDGAKDTGVMAVVSAAGCHYEL